MASAPQLSAAWACDNNDAMLAFWQAITFWTLEFTSFALAGTTFEANHITMFKSRLHVAGYMGYFLQPAHETISIWWVHTLHISRYAHKGHVLAGPCASKCCKQDPVL